jgi:hypothetical protein
MKRTMTRVGTRWVLAGLCGLAGIWVAHTAVAQEHDKAVTKRSPGKISEERERRLVGTIESIDKDTREVTLAGDGGQKETVKVSSAFKGFDQLKVGDKVNVTYMESLALSLGKPGEKPGIQTTQGSTQTPGAEGRTGGTMREVTATAEILSVNPEKHKITIKGPQGDTRTIHVENTELREKLPSLKPGDTIQLVYTEAIAGSITPAKKK